jgi:hypothetical protein
LPPASVVIFAVNFALSQRTTNVLIRRACILFKYCLLNTAIKAKDSVKYTDTVGRVQGSSPTPGFLGKKKIKITWCFCLEDREGKSEPSWESVL